MGLLSNVLSLSLEATPWDWDQNRHWKWSNDWKYSYTREIRVWDISKFGSCWNILFFGGRTFISNVDQNIRQFRQEDDSAGWRNVLDRRIYYHNVFPIYNDNDIHGIFFTRSRNCNIYEYKLQLPEWIPTRPLKNHLLNPFHLLLAPTIFVSPRFSRPLRWKRLPLPSLGLWSQPWRFPTNLPLPPRESLVSLRSRKLPWLSRVPQLYCQVQWALSKDRSDDLTQAKVAKRVKNWALSKRWTVSNLCQQNGQE